MKTVVIGLDGAGFELIDPWIETGALPNIAKIKQRGVWADMRSVLPPVTSPNWKSYSTGKNPGKLGIFWWENVDWRNRRVYYPVKRKFESKEIWDYLGEAGMKVGVVGMPTTYPPKKVNGFLIAGGPDAEEKGFAYPLNLEEELKKQGWRNHPLNIIDIDREKACREIYEIIDRQFKTADALGERYAVDFLMVAIFRSNNLHHFLWDAPETKKTWEMIDRHIGEFMDKGCDLIIMSDHGSNRIESVFNINSWLQKEGYLNLNNSIGTSLLYKLGLNRQSLAIVASRLGILRLLRGIVPKTLYRKLPNESGQIKKEVIINKVNWQKSRALASGQGPIYLNPANSDNAALKEEIKRKLETLVDSSTGKKIIERIHSKEEIYHGRYMSEAPDLIIDQAKGVHIPGGIGQRGIFDSPRRWQAENKRTGLFMAYGPDIKGTGKIDNVSILDLAPTILHLMALSVPDDMDGRVLDEVFKNVIKPARRVVKKSLGESEKERIRGKIGNLKSKGKT